MELMSDGADGWCAVGWLVTEWISGMTVRACLDRHAHLIARPSAALVGLMARIGRCIGRMHHAGVVHGDLTTSNLMLRVRLFDEGEGGQDRERGEQDTESEKQDTDDKTEKDNDEDNGGEIATETATENEPENEPETELTGSVVLIDFGLSSQTVADEDRAVDLYVLERAFTATHSSSDQLFAHAVSAYGHSYAGAPAVLRRLEEVRQRGRKRTMVG